MGTSDGTIGATTKIVDHGPAASRFNIVILAEGYQASEIPKFHTDVQNFINTFLATAPYDRLRCGINIYQVDVTSTDSGAFDPKTCGDGSPGSGTTVHTYFDATFCGDGQTRRLLTVDSTSAQNVARAQVPQVNMTMVIVNTATYGGSGGSVATFSTNSSSAQIGIHEMGHTAFHFLDEYGDIINNFAGGEPLASNVTINTNRATNKWRNLILAATAMPTRNNPNCATEDPGPSPVPTGTVGTFEGGARAHCSAFRGEFDCKMRHLAAPFCAVCQQTIVQTLTPYLVPASVTLTTPSIAFTNVPEGIGGTGVTTYRAIVFDVTSCGSITLRITAGPTGGFGTPLGTSTTVPPAEFTAFAEGRVWLSYTSATAGSNSSGSVTVHCNETGQDWIVPIVANTVARPKSAVAFVFDHSGSMSEDAGDGTTKVQKLREAANVFVNVMLQGDGIGLVRFDDTAQILMAVTDVGPAMTGAGRTTAQGIINSAQLDPAGDTSIGDGVVKGKQALDSAQLLGTPHYDVTAMVVLTDGEENTSPFLSDVSSSITAHTFAVGLGIPSNISVAALATLTQGHDGYLLITGTLTADQSMRLTKYFVQILAGITNAAVVLDPQGYLVYGVEQRVPFLVNEADMGLDVILLSVAPYLIDFELETPDGSRISAVEAGATIQFVETSNVAYYRLSLPALVPDPSGSHEGTWQAILKLGKARRNSVDAEVAASAEFTTALSLRALPYNLVVHAYSNLEFQASVQQNGFEPGAAVGFSCRLSQYDFPLEGRASVRADIVRPDGSTWVLPLEEQPAGRFVASFVADQTGLYTLRVRAQGFTLRNVPFTREQTLTAAVYPGANRPPHTGPSRDTCLCKLLACLFGEKVIGAALRRQLSDRGVNVAALQECVAAHCRCVGPGQKQTDPAATGVSTSLAELLQAPELRALVRKLVSAAASGPPADFASLPESSVAESHALPGREAESKPPKNPKRT
jgi:hypothetical protein